MLPIGWWTSMMADARVVDPGPVRCAMAKSKGQNLDISPHDARFHGAIMRGLYLYFIDGENV